MLAPPSSKEKRDETTEYLTAICLAVFSKITKKSYISQFPFNGCWRVQIKKKKLYNPTDLP